MYNLLKLLFIFANLSFQYIVKYFIIRSSILAVYFGKVNNVLCIIGFHTALTIVWTKIIIDNIAFSRFFS